MTESKFRRYSNPSPIESVEQVAETRADSAKRRIDSKLQALEAAMESLEAKLTAILEEQRRADFQQWWATEVDPSTMLPEKLREHEMERFARRMADPRGARFRLLLEGGE